MYTDALETYDTELEKFNQDLQECDKEKQQKLYELKMLNEEWGHRMEERRKTEEIQEIMRRKEEEQRKKMETLTRAAEWVQAHWRGMQARIEAEKARKKNKKGRKGKGKK